MPHLFIKSYGGWFFKIKFSNPAELNALLSPEDYKKRIGG
jgi:glycine cleavage system H lipoate-binding protein